MAKTVVKKTAGAAVAKAGSPELAAILADIQSLLQQVLAAEKAEGGEDGGEEPKPVMESKVKMAATTDENGAEGEEEEEVEKDEGAREDAEERIETSPDETDDALAAIGKTLLALQDRAVAKSATTVKKDSTVQILATIAKSLEAINRRVASNEEALIGMMEGMGVAELVQKSAPTPAAKAVQVPDAQGFIDMLAKALVQKSGASGTAPQEEMSLGDALRTLATSAPSKQ